MYSVISKVIGDECYMSMQVENGYYIDDMRLNQLNDLMFDYKKVIQNHIINDLRNKMKHQGFDFAEILNKFQSQFNAKSGDWYDLYNVNIIILPIKHKTLCLLCANNNLFREEFEKYTTVHEYRYWDGYTKSKKVSETEWEERRKDWQEAFNKEYSPTMAGFVVNTVDSTLPYMRKEDLI